MPIFNSVNIEQSIVQYLATKFDSKNYSQYYYETKQLVGSETNRITFLRSIPEDPSYFVLPNQPQDDHLVRVPVVCVRVAGGPSTEDADRMGIGESAFDWKAEVRIECLAASELQWYTFEAWFHDWLLHPDIRIDVYDYLADLTSSSPDLSGEVIRLQDIDFKRIELSNVPVAARYYTAIAATARYIE